MPKRSGIMFSMNRLSTEKRATILGMLVEGNSLRATTRMAGCSINTVSKLLLDIGAACAAYQDEHLRDLSCKTIEADEIWSFVYSKQRNVPEELKGQFGVGDVWTWTALDADSKLIVSWYVGERKYEDAAEFMLDLKDRLRDRIQLTTDGLSAYPNAVGLAFKRDIDFAQLIKQYAADPRTGQARYSPPVCTGARVRVDRGDPGPGPDQHELHRAPKPHDANGDAPVYAADQRVLEEARQPHGRHRPALPPLHPRPPPHHTRQPLPAHTRDGSRDRRPHLDHEGDRRATRLKLIHHPAIGSLYQR